MKTFLTGIVLFIGVIWTATAQQQKVATIQGAKEDDRGYIVKVGDQMPDFSVALTNGKTVSLADLKGKVVMLQFTASWCPVCRKEMPFIERDIWLKYKDRSDFALIGIDRDEPLETVVRFGTSMKVTYPLGLDPGAKLFMLVAQKEAGITRNVILDREGKIIYLTRLYNPTEFKSMTDRIAVELEKK